MIALHLPYPISANRYWRPVPIGKHITIVPTKEAKEYRKTVAALCRAAGVCAPILGRVAISLQLYPHRPLDWKTRVRKLGDGWDDTVQCIDLTNAEKVLLDALNGVAYEDDKRIFRYEAERMEPDGEARVIVRISPIVRPVPKAQQPQLIDMLHGDVELGEVVG